MSTAGSPQVRHSGLEVVDDPRGGFVLALVVLLLFGIGVAGAAGYQVVLSEALLSVHAKETQTALSIARAGLRSYIGKQIGVHEDTVTYSIEGGDAVVTARLVSEINDFETLYLLGSEGVYTDPTFTGSAARRTVYQYAVKREVALEHVAAVTQASGNVYVDDNARVWGNDQASVADCEQTSGEHRRGADGLWEPVHQRLPPQRKSGYCDLRVLRCGPGFLGDQLVDVDEYELPSGLPEHLALVRVACRLLHRDPVEWESDRAVRRLRKRCAHRGGTFYARRQFHLEWRRSRGTHHDQRRRRFHDQWASGWRTERAGVFDHLLRKPIHLPQPLHGVQGG